MEIHHEISAELIMKFEDDVSKAPLVVSDGNVPEHTLGKINKALFGIWYIFIA